MALLRIYASQDTSVTNFDPDAPTIDPTLSNVGACPIMNLYTWETSSAKVLIAFPTSSLMTLPSGSSVYLRIANAVHGETLPRGYSVTIRPIEQQWSEGAGFDIDTYSDLDVANWVNATTSTSWSLMTGTLSSSFYFSTGEEDLFTNITQMSSSIPYGLNVAITSGTSGNLFIKKFHARETFFPSKRPYLEARWSDWTGTLTTTQVFCVTSGAYSGTVWPAILASSSVSASGVIVTQFNSDVDPQVPISISIVGLKSMYDVKENTTLNVFVKRNDYNPAVVNSASITPASSTLTNAYYRVVDTGLNTSIIPFGTGVLPYTKLSYNDFGNYFNFNFSNLHSGPVYRFDFMYESPTGTGNWHVIEGDAFKFGVMETSDV